MPILSKDFIGLPIIFDFDSLPSAESPKEISKTLSRNPPENGSHAFADRQPSSGPAPAAPAPAPKEDARQAESRRQEDEEDAGQEDEKAGGKEAHGTP